MNITRINDIGCLECNDKVIQLDDEWINEMAKMQLYAQKYHHLMRVVLPRLNRNTAVQDSFSEYDILKSWLVTQQ